MSKKVYTEQDIYEGMVLECVNSEASYWIVGKRYVVDEHWCIYDEDDAKRNITRILYLLNNPDECIVKFKIVDHEEEHQVLQLFKYTFGIKTGDVETIDCYLGNQQVMLKHEFNKKHITIPAYNTQQAIEYLTNELDYDINDIVSLEVK